MSLKPAPFYTRILYLACQSILCQERKLIALLALASIIIFMAGVMGIRYAENHFLKTEGTKITRQWGNLLARDAEAYSRDGTLEKINLQIVHHMKSAGTFADISYYRFFDLSGVTIMEASPALRIDALSIRDLKFPMEQETILIHNDLEDSSSLFSVGYFPLKLMGVDEVLEIQIDLSSLKKHVSIIGLVSMSLLFAVLFTITVIGGVLMYRYGAMRKAREVELNQALQIAKDADRNKTDFLSNASHELRTPLNAIIGFTQLLSLPKVVGKGSVKQGEYTKLILEAANHLLSLVNDLLDLSKVSSGKVEFEKKPIGIEGLILSSTDLVSLQAKQAGVTIEPLVNFNSGHLIGDQRSISQIMLNLLSNAVKFTPQGGCVKVAATLNAGEELEISVSDTGIGIDGKDLLRVLEPFAQVHSEQAKKHKGTGLGLPMAKRLTELNGGEFIMESKIGVGTKVTLIFPPARHQVQLA
jgi:signal transduction histidine kinase